ncbi:MAG: hypothetical protein IPO72_05655 [Saprospiraceae bacterium]|nr:hypothetical protein [Candidatus Vicinibacter affinis]
MIVADFLNGLYSIAPDQTLKALSKESRWYFHPCKDEKGRIYLYKETRNLSTGVREIKIDS